MTDYRCTADDNILEALKQPFLDSQVKKRKGPWDKKTKSNKYFTYIPVPFIRERLDEAAGFNWDWQIISITPTTFQSKSKGTWDNNTKSYIGGGDVQETPGVVITGRLIVTLPSGKKVSRDGTGGASVDKGMGPGDAQKIAASNALKRAAYMFGVGAYLALDSDEAMDDTVAMSNDFNTFGPVSIPNQSHLNVGQGTANPPTYYPNPPDVNSSAGTTNPSYPFSIPGFSK